MIQVVVLPLPQIYVVGAKLASIALLRLPHDRGEAAPLGSSPRHPSKGARFSGMEPRSAHNLWIQRPTREVSRTGQASELASRSSGGGWWRTVGSESLAVMPTDGTRSVYGTDA